MTGAKRKKGENDRDVAQGQDEDENQIVMRRILNKVRKNKRTTNEKLPKQRYAVVDREIAMGKSK